jgi:membrane fusion protein (multidrug efflux system)
MSSDKPPPPAGSPPTPPPATAASTASAATAPPPKPSPFRYVRWGVLAVVVLIAACFGIRWFSARLSTSMTEDAFVEAHIINVAPEMVSGRIVRFLVEENDRVDQGQVVAEIDPIHYRDQVDQARGKLELADAELKRQEAGLDKLKKEVPLQIEVAQQSLAAAKTEEGRAEAALKLATDEIERTIDEGRAAVELAKANLLLAKQEFDRFIALAAQDATTTRKAEEVTRTHDAAKAELRLAEAKLAKAEAARSKIDVARRDLEAARTLVTKSAKLRDLAETGYDQIREVELLVDVKKEMRKDAKIGLDSATHQFEFTRIRAPVGGVVVKRYRSLGDFASAGTPILSMYDTDLLYVTANLEETRLRGVAPGNAVELRIDAFDRPFNGRVVWINRSTGAQFALMPRNVVAGEFTKVVQRVPVRIWIEKDDRWPSLRAGLSAEAIISHGPGDAAWAEKAARDMADIEKRRNRPND